MERGDDHRWSRKWWPRLCGPERIRSKKVGAATLYEILGRMSYQGEVSVRRLSAGTDLDEASLAQDYGVGGDGAEDTVAVLAIFGELEEGPGVVLPHYVAGVDRGNSHKITKGLAFYDAYARVLDFLSSTPRARASSGRSGSVSATVFPSVPPSIPMSRRVPASAPPIANSAASVRIGRTTRSTELGNFVASC
jgi:hypothetical protein